MAKWERHEHGIRRRDGTSENDIYVKHTYTIGRVVISLSKSMAPSRFGEWVMMCWPWAESMPLEAKQGDEIAAKKESLEWVRQKFVAAVTEIKWSQGC